MKQDEAYMYRCIQLAQLGRGNVEPNPMVGSALVYKDEIIGEGYHAKYGEAHAEVNCINSVSEENKHLIQFATLYVSLEPCAHFGKTPPCADLIVKEKIPKVIIGCSDSFEQVAGKGIEKLINAGIDVKVGVLGKECIELNKRFFTFHNKKRPYIILKWAETNNQFIGTKDERLLITNDTTNKLVHKWRSEEAAILIGMNTALQDNPQLNSRLPIKNIHQPIRLVIDKHLQLPSTLNIFNPSQRTILFNYIIDKEENGILFVQINKDKNLLEEILSACYKFGIQSILVEGGAITLQSFINQNLWDEARIITNTTLSINEGINAPKLLFNKLANTFMLENDKVNIYENKFSKS